MNDKEQKDKEFLRVLPAIISLSAGLVISIAMLVKKQKPVYSLAMVFGALLIFYIVGLIFRAVLLAIATKEEPEEENTEELENLDTEAANNDAKE